MVKAAWKALPVRFNGIVLFFTLAVQHIKKPFDVIHCHSTFPTGAVGVLFGKIFRVPVVVSLDGGEGISVDFVDFGDLRSKRRTKLNKWILKHAAVVTTLTNYHLSLITRNLNIRRKILVVTRGVDVDLFKPNSVSPEIERPIRFLFVGYLSPIKNPELLIESFAILQSRIACTLTIVGKDYLHGRIRDRVSVLDLNHVVNFIETLEYAEMPALYRQADVLLVTSRFESQGMAIVEAMASGVVVCGNPVGLLADLSEDICVKIDASDPIEFSENILTVLRDVRRMHSIRKAAREWCVANDIHKTVEKLTEIYDRIGK